MKAGPTCKSDPALSNRCYHLLYPYDSQMVTKSKDERFTIMANNPETTSVEKAESLLAEMKDRAMEAHRTGDQFTMSLMQELIKVTSPIVTKAVNRYHREERA